MFTNSPSDLTHSVIDHTAQTAGAAIQTTQRVANDAIEGLSHSLHSVQHSVRDSVHHASDRTVAYIREEPMKSVLFAAATGAALMALASAIGRPHHPR